MPRKNLRLLGGRPLIAWTIERARAARSLDRIIVSTEDDEIADAARAMGAEVPFLRPAELARDDTPDLPVFEHVLAWLEQREGYLPDAVIHLRPTLPFRTVAQIDDVVRLMGTPDVDCVKSVYPSDKHPHKMWELGDGRLEPYVKSQFRREVGPDYPHQMLEPVYWSAGLVDGITQRTIVEGRSTTGMRVLPYLVEREACVDLDTEHDFLVAEAILAAAREEGAAWAS